MYHTNMKMYSTWDGIFVWWGYDFGYTMYKLRFVNTHHTLTYFPEKYYDSSRLNNFGSSRKFFYFSDMEIMSMETKWYWLSPFPNLLHFKAWFKLKSNLWEIILKWIHKPLLSMYLECDGKFKRLHQSEYVVHSYIVQISVILIKY